VLSVSSRTRLGPECEFCNSDEIAVDSICDATDVCGCFDCDVVLLMYFIFKWVIRVVLRAVAV